MTALTASVRAPLMDGRLVTIRHLALGDEPGVLGLHDGLTETSRYLRFFAPGRRTAQTFVHRLIADVGQPGHGALLAELDGQVIGLASYSAAEDATVADVAFAVADSEQAHGLGTLLCEHLVSLARSRGVRTFTADVLAANARMFHVFQDLGLPVRTHCEDGAVRVEIGLGPDADHLESDYLDATAAREIVADVASLRPLLRPASVVVVGASRRADAVGHAVLRNLLASGFSGPVYAVNPQADSVLGLPCHRSVSDLPEVPELAVVCVPAQRVPAVARECGERGVRALAVLSAGITGEGDLEAELRAVVREHGMRLVGPNCLGVASLSDGYALDATFARRLTKPGPVGVVTQSGGVGIALLEQFDRIGLGISSFVSTGDKYDVSSNDLLMWWDADQGTEAAVLYLESFGNPRKFARVARRLGRTKPVLTVRSGTSDVARRAAASHTAAAATPAVTRDALFRQAGVIAVDGLSELVAATAVLTCQPLPASRRVAVVSNAGGAGVLAADACASSGLVMPDLSAETRAALAALVPSTASLANPVDTTAAVSAATFEQCLRVVLDDPGVDGVIAISAPTALGDLGPAIVAAAAATTKPVIGVRLDQGETLDLVSSAGSGGRVPMFADPHAAVAAYASSSAYAQWRQAPRGRIPDLPDVDAARGRRVVADVLAKNPAGGWLDPADADELLDAFGIPAARSEHAATADHAVDAADRLGGPVAMKAVVPGLLHKSDSGGVLLRLGDEDAVRAAFRDMRERFGDTLRHVVIQRMVPAGVETLVGVVSDATFGPLVVFGAGGVVTDLLGDRVSRLAPVSDLDAAQMVRGLKSSPMLFGFRGAPAADTAAAEDVLMRVGRLAETLPEVAELELNPLVVHEHGALAVDVRIKVVPREGGDPYLRRLR